MKVWILSIPRGNQELHPSEDAVNEAIVRLAKSGAITGRVTVTTADLDISKFPVLTQGPANDDYVIDDSGDRWDYFPHMNQYRLRTNLHIPGHYHEGIGFQPQAEIQRRYGLHKVVNNGTTTFPI